MFHYSVVFQLFCQYFVVPPVFRCSTGVPCPVVPFSGVPGFYGMPLHRSIKITDDFHKVSMFLLEIYKERYVN